MKAWHKTCTTLTAGTTAELHSRRRRPARLDVAAGDERAEAREHPSQGAGEASTQGVRCGGGRVRLAHPGARGLGRGQHVRVLAGPLCRRNGDRRSEYGASETAQPPTHAAPLAPPFDFQYCTALSTPNSPGSASPGSSCSRLFSAADPLPSGAFPFPSGPGPGPFPPPAALLGDADTVASLLWKLGPAFAARRAISSSFSLHSPTDMPRVSSTARTAASASIRWSSKDSSGVTRSAGAAAAEAGGGGGGGLAALAAAGDTCFSWGRFCAGSAFELWLPELPKNGSGKGTDGLLLLRWMITCRRRWRRRGARSFVQTHTLSAIAGVVQLQSRARRRKSHRSLLRLLHRWSLRHWRLGRLRSSSRSGGWRRLWLRLGLRRRRRRLRRRLRLRLRLRRRGRGRGRGGRRRLRRQPLQEVQRRGPGGWPRRRKVLDDEFREVRVAELHLVAWRRGAAAAEGVKRSCSVAHRLVRLRKTLCVQRDPALISPCGTHRSPRAS